MKTKKSKFKIAIINYNLSNLYSINNALSSLKYNTIITNSKKDILSSDLVVLPGVGAFNKAISNLKNMKIFDLIQSMYINKKPILPSSNEISQNPPSRSAKLRYGIKTNNKCDFSEFREKFNNLINVENLR